MYDDAARLYDLIHEAQGRDADAEADIDVACGTGAHLPRFARTYEVTGVDLSDGMLAIAASRCPGVSLVKADMRAFDLNRRFDAVVCLFSGIGYLTEEADLRRAVATMAEHLTPGGVLLIEGWVEPDAWLGSSGNAESGRIDGMAVARVLRSQRDGMRTDLFMRYVVATAGEITTIDSTTRCACPIPTSSKPRTWRQVSTSSVCPTCSTRGEPSTLEERTHEGAAIQGARARRDRCRRRPRARRRVPPLGTVIQLTRRARQGAYFSRRTSQRRRLALSKADSAANWPMLVDRVG